jgi:hypothetical protein
VYSAPVQSRKDLQKVPPAAATFPASSHRITVSLTRWLGNTVFLTADRDPHFETYVHMSVRQDTRLRCLQPRICRDMDAANHRHGFFRLYVFMTESVTVTCIVTATERAQLYVLHSRAELILRVPCATWIAFLSLIHKLFRNLAFQRATSLYENI